MFLLESESFSDTSLDAVALDGGGGVPARDQDAQPRPRAAGPREIEGVAAEVATLAFAQQSFELRLAPQPARSIESETFARRRYYD